MILPDGHQEQPAWAVRDRDGVSWQFHRVYGPPDVLDRRGPTCQLIEALSYWDALADGRSITYTQALAQRGSRLTFAQFSSPDWRKT